MNEAIYLPNERNDTLIEILTFSSSRRTLLQSFIKVNTLRLTVAV